jgi:hypothetical protein
MNNYEIYLSFIWYYYFFFKYINYFFLYCWKNENNTFFNEISTKKNTIIKQLSFVMYYEIN